MDNSVSLNGHIRRSWRRRPLTVARQWEREPQKAAVEIPNMSLSFGWPGARRQAFMNKSKRNPPHRAMAN
ncbi:hypothetical protein C7U60_03110 [Mesorhizobium plurifarium]|nr:hypothetical protein C7U60_03110 [Mesorhizobium plurifarium]